LTSVQKSPTLKSVRAESQLVPRRVLIFDLSEVLVGGLFGVVAPLAGRLGMPQDAVSGALGGEAWLAFMEGRCDENGYWRSVLDQTGWAIPAPELAALAREAFREPVPGMPELLSRLAGHRLVLLSDHGREWMDFIRQSHPFLECISRRFLSYEMGQTKRRIDTFHRVVRELGCAADGCLFIDDLPQNIERATTAGIPSLHFRSAAELAEDLATAGIALE
jgi:HAD superfamily hydrolase (TIGR01509 family)